MGTWLERAKKGVGRPRYNGNLKSKITICIDNIVLNDLDDIVKYEGGTRSAFIEEAIRRYYKLDN